MHQPTSDLRISTARPLLSPVILEEDLPLSDTGASLVQGARRAISAILHGRDDRLIAIVGPCSIHDPAAAAFVGMNDLRADQNSVVALNFAEFAAFNGLPTAAGYTFQSQLAADTEIYRIGFAVAPVPEPQTYVLMALGLALVGWVGSRKSKG